LLFPSLYALVTLFDGSVMGGVEVPHTRFTHSSFPSRGFGLGGYDRSEFGLRQVHGRVELCFRVAWRTDTIRDLSCQLRWLIFFLLNPWTHHP
jgi:hypothetical protein